MNDTVFHTRDHATHHLLNSNVQPGNGRYRRHRDAGLCGQGSCPKQAVAGKAQCRSHLIAMTRRAAERRSVRLALGICIRCGARPSFWGRRCIICRQLFAKDPLPYGARTALRKYRDAEAAREHQRIMEETRQAAAMLLEQGQILDKEAHALRLYVGIDNGGWRSYKQVGALMNLSSERVRQLLCPAKRILKQSLSSETP